MLIPEKALLHLLNTGEYQENREEGTITVIVSKKEIYVLPVDDVLTELYNFINFNTHKADKLSSDNTNVS